MVDNFIEVWSFFDPDATGFLSIKQFETFMIQLDKPLGWTLDEALNKKFQSDFMKNRLDLNLYS